MYPGGELNQRPFALRMTPNQLRHADVGQVCQTVCRHTIKAQYLSKAILLYSLDLNLNHSFFLKKVILIQIDLKS